MEQERTRPRVLFLSYAFPPLAAPEAILSVKAAHSLVDVDVDVVAAAPALGWQRRDPSLVSYANEAATSIERVQVPWWLPAVQPTRALRRYPDAMRFLNRRLLHLLDRRDIDSYDCVVTWSQWHSIHLAGLQLKQRHSRMRWVAHFSDPWVGNPLRPLGGLAERINLRMEKRVVEHADVLTFTTDASRRLTLETTGRAPTDTAVITHAFDPTLYGSEGRTRRSTARVVRYIGSFYGGRGPAPLVDALQLVLRTQPHALDGVTVEIVGPVPPAMRRAVAAELPPRLVRFVAPVDYLRSLRLMREADVLLLVDAPAASNVFLASKLVDYVGARRPIVGLTPPGVAADLIRSLGGWVGDPLDPSSAAAALMAGLDASRAEADDGLWGDPAVVQRYHIDQVGRQRRRVLLGA